MLDDNHENDAKFNELYVEERLQALYSPGLYDQGEELCLEILEELYPDWERARLFLFLNLAAQDVDEEAIEMIDELSDESLFDALGQLAFGEGTETEEAAYQDILLCLQQRGLEEQLEMYLNTPVIPWDREDLVLIPQPWRLGLGRENLDNDDKPRAKARAKSKKRIVRTIVHKIKRTHRRN